MKRLLFIPLLLALSFQVNAQETEKVWRINFLNPGIVYETPVSSNSTISINAGIGYNGSYPNLSDTRQSGFQYAIAPFLDLQFKRFYNLQKRDRMDKTTRNNSGNFISLRFRMRGKSIDDNFSRKAPFDFAFGPTWGIQRTYGGFHLLFDIGSQFYFDSEGNVGFWPLIPQVNLGFDL